MAPTVDEAPPRDRAGALTIERAFWIGISQRIEYRKWARPGGSVSFFGFVQDRGVGSANGFKVTGADQFLSGKFDGDHLLRNKTVDRSDNRDQESTAKQHEFRAGREVLEHWTARIRSPVKMTVPKGAFVITSPEHLPPAHRRNQVKRLNCTMIPK